MKKPTKVIVIIFLFMSILNPILFLGVGKTKTDAEQLSDFSITETANPSVFTVGACGPRSIMNWDPTTYVVSTGDYYLDSALECLFTLPFNTTGDLTELKPVLATSWTYEYRPDEMDALGIKHYAGIKSVEITLRQNVKFHDGSNWNATVCKWNIDRVMYILGNINDCITGNPDSNLRSTRDTYWLRISDWEDYSTSHWNISKFYGIASYPGYGFSGDFIDRFPRFTNVTIIEDLQSGGKVRIFFNDWRTGPIYLAGIKMISMNTYKNYFDVPIFGYGQDPSFPQDNPAVFPGHLIGTGPYIFQGHEIDAGTMFRFDDWWNASAQQAEGFHTIPEVALTTFAHTEAGYQARSTAMVTGDIDFAYDRSWEPLNYDDMIAAPEVSYIPLGVEAYGENIILNCINETYLRYWSDVGANVTYFGLPSTFVVSGIVNQVGPHTQTLNAHGTNRAFRKALNYAFDYDTYIHVAFNDRVARSGGFLAKTHEYYNPSIFLPYRNLTIARQALLDDPFWAPLCADRGLSLASTTTEWRNVASVNPIYNFEYNYDQAHLEVLSIMTESLKDIGCGIDLTEDIPDTYTKMTAYFTFPWFTCDGFSFKPYFPRINSIEYYSAYYKSPGVVEHSAYGYPIADWPAGYIYPGQPYPGYIFPYVQFANWGFNYNASCDDLISKLWFQNATGQQRIFDKLTDWAQNFQYPNIWIGNDLIGYAINKGYTYSWRWDTFRFNLVKSITLPVPGSFVLSSNAGIPDGDGSFDLTWTSSTDADNYSVYEYNDYISVINGSLTTLATQIATLTIPLSGYFTGTYYFIVVAHNQYGDTLSNCIVVTVSLPQFLLASNAEDPDDDGIFDLLWTSASGANNYSVYEYNSYITKINGSLILLAHEITPHTLPLSGYTTGTYYFIVVAHSNQWDSLSNCVEVVIQITAGDGEPGIPGYNLIYLFALGGISAIYLIIVCRKKQYK